jgi:hypothetical protein
MGYQRVDVRMSDGREVIDALVFNAQEIELPDDCRDVEIQEIRLHQRSQNEIRRPAASAIRAIKFARYSCSGFFAPARNKSTACQISRAGASYVVSGPAVSTPNQRPNSSWMIR